MQSVWSRCLNVARLNTVAVLALSVLVATGCATRTATQADTQAASSEESASAADARRLAREATTPAVAPPFVVSDDATSAQLERALDDGKAVRAELEWVEREESAASGELAAGEYIVTYLITPVDDYYDLEAAQSSSPAHHTTVQPGSAHVSVVVRDASDGRMVQGLDVRATLRPDSGGRSRTVTLPFGWHPILNRYGENVVLPDGSFTLAVHIAMPAYRRGDAINGNRFTRDVTAIFPHVSVSTDSLAAASRRLAHGESRESVRLANREAEILDGQIAEALRSDGEAGAHGLEVRSGDYRVAVTVQAARGYWQVRAGTLTYVRTDTSVGPAAHIGVTVRDAETGRFIPGLKVRATLLDARGREIDTYAMPFMWHPWLNHYGLNVAVPGQGRYTVHVHADAPGFRRYGSSALRKFNRSVNAEVRGLRFAR
ncbi:MAG: iron transporter [Gemmatimonadota bacterium]|nr:iron transporter [Gemmatimonadota bacterium]